MDLTMMLLTGYVIFLLMVWAFVHAATKDEMPKPEQRPTPEAVEPEPEVETSAAVYYLSRYHRKTGA